MTMETAHNPSYLLQFLLLLGCDQLQVTEGLNPVDPRTKENLLSCNWKFGFSMGVLPQIPVLSLLSLPPAHPINVSLFFYSLRTGHVLSCPHGPCMPANPMVAFSKKEMGLSFSSFRKSQCPVLMAHLGAYSQPSVVGSKGSISLRYVLCLEAGLP